LSEFLNKIGSGPNGPIKQILFLPDDNGFLFTGDFDEFSGQPVNYMVRLKQDGSINQDFMKNIGSAPPAGINHTICLPNGNILLLGNFGDFNDQKTDYLVCLNKDGKINSNFMNNIGTGANGRLDHAEYFPIDNNIVLTGGFNRFNEHIAGGIARLDDGGILDHEFMVNVGKGLPIDDEIFCRVLGFSGERILLTGKFSEFNWNKTGNIVLLNWDGLINEQFLKNIGAGANGFISSAFLLNDHNILLLGKFSKFNRIKTNGVVSIGPEGLINEHFMSNLSIWCNDRITHALTLPDQNILLFGDFDKRKNGKLSGRVVHLNKDGTVIEGERRIDKDKGLNYDTSIIEQALYLPDGSILIIGDGGNSEFIFYNL